MKVITIFHSIRLKYRFQAFNDIRNSVLTGLNNEENVGRTLQLCSEYRKCAGRMKCKAHDVIVGYNDKLLILCEAIELLKIGAVDVYNGEAVEKLLILCDVNDFRKSVGFKECAVKLEANRTTCYREWNPFPNKVEKKKIEEIQKEACKNFFGKDNCMEKEIFDKCGLEMWKLHKKHYLAMNSATGACKFD
ncbi:Protein CBG00770 [Caenorhabditis briggsae]|uniref:Protein CBG00770 n=1 Tax=Caenorhabditis briggsae TaxID=6238 RepID=A8WNS6_CAEBR|nr:Protein CBG00770 [Caenorhabditis briggsae]CAP22132.2 Protein CBG00770 [Caenorhabditis briggsae]